MNFGNSGLKINKVVEILTQEFNEMWNLWLVVGIGSTEFHKVFNSDPGKGQKCWENRIVYH